MIMQCGDTGGLVKSDWGSSSAAGFKLQQLRLLADDRDHHGDKHRDHNHDGDQYNDHVVNGYE